MSMNMTELLAQLGDDVQFDYNPETYADATGPRLPDAGVYLAKATKITLVTTKDGKLVFDKDPDTGEATYPVVKLEGIEIIEPAEAARKVMLFQRLKTRPFTRTGKDGQPEKASNVADFVRAYDQTRRPSRGGVQGLVALLEEFSQQGATFRCKLDWCCDGYQGAKAELEQAEANGTVFDQAAKNKVYDRYRLKGQAKFPKGANGQRSPFWTAPNGEILEAQVEIVRFIPSLEQVKLGPLYS